jgi:hypothetical protein
MRERTVKGISNLIAASVALLAGSAPALANLCEEGRNPPQRYLDEAGALQSEAFTAAAGYAGSKAYDARVLTCNRRRDTLGNDVDQAIAAKHTFAATLPPLLVKGHIRYLGTILGEVRYGYELRRDGGTWKVTVPAQFYLPGRDDQALDVPLLLAVAPTKDGGLGIVCDSQAHPKVITNPGLGDEFQACRVGRGERFGGQRPDTLLFKYWKQEIERFWTRPGFTVVVRIVNLGEVDDITLKGYEKENIVWPVRFNDRPESRATYKAVVGKAHPLFSGLPATTFVHEFGHVMGNDDEYPEPAPVVGGAPPSWRDCPALGGTDYIMCDKPLAPPATNAKGLYAWIATRRYAVADPSRYQCKTSSDCPDGRFCDTGTLTSGPNLCVPARPECAACDADKQCLAPMTCAGKPLGRCARSEARPIGTACCRDDQCGSKSCNSGGHCQCKEDAQCPPGQFCALGTLTLGQNRCLPRYRSGPRAAGTSSVARAAALPSRAFASAPPIGTAPPASTATRGRWVSDTTSASAIPSRCAPPAPATACALRRWPVSENRSGTARRALRSSSGEPAAPTISARARSARVACAPAATTAIAPARNARSRSSGPTTASDRALSRRATAAPDN